MLSFLTWIVVFSRVYYYAVSASWRRSLAHCSPGIRLRISRKLFLPAYAFRARPYHCAGRCRPLAQRRAGECAASASQFTARYARLHRGRLRSAWHVIAMTLKVIGAGGCNQVMWGTGRTSRKNPIACIVEIF